MSWERPPARRRRTFWMTTEVGGRRLAPHVLDAAASARMLSVVILVAVVAAAVQIATSANFYIYNPAVIDNQRVPAGEIVAASGMETLHVLWLQPERTAAELVKRMPELRSAYIWCGFPAACSIQVMERQPVFEWRQGQMRTWVDVQGVAFAARGQATELAVVEAPTGQPALLPGQRTDEELVRSMLTLASVLPEIRQYRYTLEHGVEFGDPKGNWPVYLGTGKDMAARVAMWKALGASLSSRNIRPKFVDVRYANAPFYMK